MFKVGDLVRYKKIAVDNDSIGLIIKQNCVFGKFWLIQWLDGSKFQESECYLEVVKN